MKAVQIVGPRKIVSLDAPMPECLEGEVLVQCSHVALCGSNMGQYTGEGVWADLDLPQPTGWAGHENIGRIVESRCEGWQVGQLVLAQPEGYFGFAEFIRSKPPGIALLPDDPPDVGGLIVAQPLATILRAMTYTENVINQRCAVVGQGPMGLVWTHVLGLMAARSVIAADLLAWRLEWSKRFGARDVIDASAEDVVERVRELTGGEMIDFVVDAAGTPESMNTSAQLVRRGGRLYIFGMPDYNDQRFRWYATFRNETKIITCVGPQCGAFFQTAADMVADGRASDLAATVTPRMPWEKAAEAFEMYANCDEGSLKLTLEL